MDVKAGKLKIVNDILTFKASCDTFPALKLTNSLPSINNLLNAISFLLDLIKSVVGVEVLKDKLIDILSYELEGFELAIKKILKSLFKEVFSCGISPTIPVNLINVGIDFDLERIDFFNILKVNPTSIEGSIVYGDPNKDFNYFLYNTIQLGTPNSWKNLLIVTFIPTGAIVDGQPKNNVINVKINPSYSNKSIFQFLNDFIDSMRFLPETNTTPRIIDTVFGTISKSISKDLITLKKEAEFEMIVEKILSKSSDNEVEIDNTYIDFTNDERFEVEKRALLLQNGVTILEECDSVVSEVSLKSVENLLVSLSGTTTAGERKTVLVSQLDIMAEESTTNVDKENKPLGKLNFFLKLIKGLILVILKSISGPAIILTISIYLKLSYGVLNFNDLKDFVKKNLKFYTDMIKKIIIETIQRVLLTFLINLLKELIVCNLLQNTKQMRKQYQLTLAGLTGSFASEQLRLLGQLQSLGLRG